MSDSWIPGQAFTTRASSLAVGRCPGQCDFLVDDVKLADSWEGGASTGQGQCLAEWSEQGQSAGVQLSGRVPNEEARE